MLPFSLIIFIFSGEQVSGCWIWNKKGKHKWKKNLKQNTGPRAEPFSKGGVEIEGQSWRTIREKLVESDGIQNSGWSYWISGTAF